ncbi:hypothetical protein ACJ73_07938, partial [Blastomyces percursus]
VTQTQRSLRYWKVRERCPQDQARLTMSREERLITSHEVNDTIRSTMKQRMMKVIVKSTPRATDPTDVLLLGHQRAASYPADIRHSLTTPQEFV